MENQISKNSDVIEKNTSNPKDAAKKNAPSAMKSSQLMKLFEDELKDIYWAEKALTKAIPKLIENATSEKLIKALKTHLTETDGQVARLESVFELMGKKAEAKKCEAMAGLIKESEGIMADCEEGPMRDAGIISAGQKVEHYEIASYGTLCQFAKILGLKKEGALLKLTLDEEKMADENLTNVANSEVNIDAAEQPAKI